MSKYQNREWVENRIYGLLDTLDRFNVIDYSKMETATFAFRLEKYWDERIYGTRKYSSGERKERQAQTVRRQQGQ